METIIVIQVGDGGDETQTGTSVTIKKWINSREVLEMKLTGIGGLNGCE